jgi:mono/diheme cytochrome c family protein
MRHQLTTRFAIVLSAVLVVAAVAWAGLARTVGTVDGEDRTETVLGLAGDVDRGRELFLDTPGRACASCHSFDALGVEADGGPPIESLDPTRQETIASLLAGTVPAHDEYDYEHVLSDQQIADLLAVLHGADDD